MSAADPSITVTTETSLKSHAGDWESRVLNRAEYEAFIGKMKRTLAGMQNAELSFISKDMDGDVLGGKDVPISSVASKRKSGDGDTITDIVACDLVSSKKMRVSINRDYIFYKELSSLMDEAVKECQSIPRQQRGAQRHYTLLNEQVPEFSIRVVAHFAAKNIPLVQERESPAADGQYLQLSLPRANGTSCRDDKWRIALLTKRGDHIQREEIASVRPLGGISQLNLNYGYSDFKDMARLMQYVKENAPPVRAFSEEQVAVDAAIRRRADEIRQQNQSQEAGSVLPQNIPPQTTHEVLQEPSPWSKKVFATLLPASLLR